MVRRGDGIAHDGTGAEGGRRDFVAKNVMVRRGYGIVHDGTGLDEGRRYLNTNNGIVRSATAAHTTRRGSITDVVNPMHITQWGAAATVAWGPV
jgi:hypothetical protein